MKIFISYSRFDKKQVFKLKSEIDKFIGIKTCWLDLTGIESDQQFVDVIIDAINQSEIFLFMYSNNSEKSEWTRKEIDYAQMKGKKIVFVKLGNIKLNNYYLFQYGSHDIINIFDKDEKNKLLRNLKSWCCIEDSNDTDAISDCTINKKKDKITDESESNTTDKKDVIDQYLKFFKTNKWYISAAIVCFLLGYFSVDLIKYSNEGNTIEIESTFIDSLHVDSIKTDTYVVDETLEKAIDKSGKDSTKIMQAQLKSYLYKTDSICKFVQDKKGDRRIIGALRDANWFYYFQAKFLTKKIYDRDIERNIELDQLVGREYQYWVEKGNKLGKNKNNYALKKQYYENAYRLKETGRLKSYIEWLDKQLKS